MEKEGSEGVRNDSRKLCECTWAKEKMTICLKLLCFLSNGSFAAFNYFPPIIICMMMIMMMMMMMITTCSSAGLHSIHQMGTTAESLSNSAQSHAENETLKFVEPIEEYARMLASIKLAMRQRQNIKNTYINCITDVESKQASYQKLLGVPGKEAQATAKEQAVVNAQQAADAAKVEFEKVSERLLNEFELFKNQKATDIKEIILSFVQLEVSAQPLLVLLYCSYLDVYQAEMISRLPHFFRFQ